MHHGPTDWATGERVFAPPSGTLDVDWLVPALLEACPGTAPAAARAVLAEAWSARRSRRTPPDGSELERAADRVVAAAQEEFRA